MKSAKKYLNEVINNYRYKEVDFDCLPSVLHITHNDADALGCALVVGLAFDRYNFLVSTRFTPAGGGADAKVLDLLNYSIYGNTERDSDITDIRDYTKYATRINSRLLPNVIIISDNSINNDTKEFLEFLRDNYGVVLMGFDHHKSNTIDCDWFYVTKSNNAACKLVYKAFYGMLDKEKASLLQMISAISRYDTWKWKTKPTTYPMMINEDLYTVAIKTLGINIAFDEAYNFFSNVSRMQNECLKRLRYTSPKFRTIYCANYIKTENAIKSILDEDGQGRTYMKIPFRDSESKVSILLGGDGFENVKADALLSPESRMSDSDIVITLYPESFRVSMRSASVDIDSSNITDVSKVAIANGGGGHTHAAGFKNEAICNELGKIFFILNSNNPEAHDDFEKARDYLISLFEPAI